jgi:hypothetical protein
LELVAFDSLPFTFDWSDWMEEGDTIYSAEITATPDGLGIGPSQTDTVASTVQAMISGGVNGVTYTVNRQIITQAGLIANSQELLLVADNVRRDPRPLVLATNAQSKYGFLAVWGG